MHKVSKVSCAAAVDALRDNVISDSTNGDGDTACNWGHNSLLIFSFSFTIISHTKSSLYKNTTYLNAIKNN